MEIPDMDLAETQRLLIANGYDLGKGGPSGKGDDGVYGANTERAILAFQKSKSLQGDVGVATISALEAAVAGKRAAASHFTYPTSADLKAIFPSAKATYLDPFVRALPKVAPAEKMDSVLRLGHFIAQCGWECDQFKTFEEYASGAGYEGRKDLGNILRGDGKRFKGRGPIQLTGRDNYRRATPFVRSLLGRPDLDLEKTPEIVASDREVGVATSLWYWVTNGLNTYADKDDAKAVSRGVNRGNPKSTSAANHEAERIAITKKTIAMMERIQKRAA